MGRLTYVCTACSEHFTRKYSAKRHNITIHHNKGGEIVPLVEYLVGRKSGRYQASHPSWYRRSEKSIHKFGRATVADSMGNTFGPVRQYRHHQQSSEEQERYRQQAFSPSIPPAAIQNVPPYPTDQISQPMNTTDDEEKAATALSQETVLKIQELKRLIYKYPQYHRSIDAIIKY